MWSPFEIEIMLFHYCCYGEFSRRSAPIYPETVRRLVELGLLQTSVEEDREFATTPLGAALVEAWKDTPVPVARYVDPRFEHQ